MLNLYLRTGNPDTAPNFATTTALVNYLKTILNYPGLTQDVTINIQGGTGTSFGLDNTINSAKPTAPASVNLFNGFNITVQTDPADLPTTGPGLLRGGLSFGNHVPSTRPYISKFTVSGVSPVPAAADTYTHNGQTYTIRYATSSVIFASMQSTPANPLASGTLTRATGSGQASIAFSAVSNDMLFNDGGQTIWNGLLLTYNGMISVNGGFGPFDNGNNLSGQKTAKITNCIIYLINTLAATDLSCLGSGCSYSSPCIYTVENNTIFMIAISSTPTKFHFLVEGNASGLSHIVSNNILCIWKTSASAGTFSIYQQSLTGAIFDTNVGFDYAGGSMSFGGDITPINCSVANPNLVTPIIQSASDSINTMIGRSAQPTGSSAALIGMANQTYATAVDILGHSRS